MSSIIALFQNPAPNDTSNRKQVMKHSLIEFCATTIFVYFGTLSAVSTGTHMKDSDTTDVARIFPIAFTFGMTIMCLAYSIGHISGGHMNPGVSLLMFFQRKMSFVKMMAYWMAQFTGACVASLLLWWSVNHRLSTVVVAADHKDDGSVIMMEEHIYGKVPFLLGSTTLDQNLSTGNGFLLELFGSFFFYFVISQTTLDLSGRIANSSFPAIPIGFSLIVVHICLIPFTGCGVNPARTFGPAVVACIISSNGSMALEANDDDICSAVMGDWWYIYFIGPAVAAFLVAEITALIQWDVSSPEDMTVLKMAPTAIMDDYNDEEYDIEK